MLVSWQVGRLKSFNPRIRERAAKKLRKAAPSNRFRVCSALYAALDDEFPNVRLIAAESLRSLGWEPQNVNERAWMALSNEVFEPIISEGEAGIDAVLALASGRTSYRLGLITNTIRDQNLIRKVLNAALQRPELQYEAVRVIGKFRDHPKLGDLLLPVLPRFGTWVLKSLAVSGCSPSALPLLTELFELRQYRDWRLIAQIIAKIRAQGLGKLVGEDSKTPAFLIDRLQDDQSVVRHSAAEALEIMGWEPADIDQELSFLLAQVPHNRGAIAKRGSPAVDRLMRLLGMHDKHPPDRKRWDYASESSDRQNWVEVLGETSDARAVHVLREVATADPEPRVRACAIRALADNFDSTTDLSDLLYAALQDDRQCVDAAAEVLRRLGDNRALEPLLALPDQSISGAVIAAFAEFANPLVVKRLVSFARRGLCSESCVRALEKILDEKPSIVDYEDLRVIARLKPPDLYSEYVGAPGGVECVVQEWTPVDCGEVKRLAKQELAGRVQTQLNSRR